ncbi:MAG: helix-turn-helix transcriptional regulator [Alistipes sp.]|nr:helix-turn-helix transcriptional regulator [Alistipes sp.]
MKDKLRDLLESEGLKPGQFAEMLGINPAGVSHLLAGRNKPGFELLQKILRRFPRVNPDWLLLDQGAMYRTTVSESTSTVTEPELANSIGSVNETAPIASSGNLFEEKPTTPRMPSQQKGISSKANVARVVIFYEDQTFESFTPSQQG